MAKKKDLPAKNQTETSVTYIISLVQKRPFGSFRSIESKRRNLPKLRTTSEQFD